MTQNTTRSDTPGVIALPPLLYGVTLGVGFLMQWIAPRPILTSNARYWIGGAALALGLALAIWGRRAMDRAGTNVNPNYPTTAVVTSGAFSLSRNPLYVALNLVYVGLALLVNALWVLVLFVPLVVVMHFGVILREERYLAQKFGDPYRAYRARVRRYL